MAATGTAREMEIMYEETIQLKSATDFGMDMPSTLFGPAPVPPEGVRLDVPFEGKISGARLRGTIAGTDYVYFRPDRVGRLHVHAVITTEDGDRVAYFCDGVVTVDGGVARLQENVTLHTAATRLGWVNRMQIWASGTLDLSTGAGTLKGFAT